ncbi:protein phosphatase regulator [Beauveria bassiana ARSEF 2860]|uniref:Protein phosphatase regulator n=1 Tax=Beauveria bassiana (strain ARSEF 2860) TaxID=655819 RepID=J4VSD8_BEAB2|nr:protein phosphatase regulator [Beauveria bassiana ARSEF 2860]EJP61515.1 protein phosphatase regulator [Beauveria bassiana ARSEF 2860]
MVHFDSTVQVCPFFQLESPIAISTESSCADDGQLGRDQLPDLYSFPSTGDDSDDSDGEDSVWVINPTYTREPEKPDATSFVQLCGLRLSSDNKLICGSLAVAATTGTQSAACRFTFDGWETVSEVCAMPTRQAEQGMGYDWFHFEVNISGLAHLKRRSCILCVRCIIDGQEYWDNNAGSNFRVHFIRQHHHRRQKQGQQQHHQTRQQNIVDTARWLCPLTTAKSSAPATDYFDISCASYEDIIDKYCFVCI